MNTQQGRRMNARVVGFLLLVLLGLTPMAARAADAPLCFSGVPGIDQCISGRFRTYWEQNGGLAVFGYPLTGAFSEQTETSTLLVQYFERQRFELHPENTAPYDVLLGRLGDYARNAQVGTPRSLGPMPARAKCRYFSETGFNLCGEFKAYWESARPRPWRPRHQRPREPGAPRLPRDRPLPVYVGARLSEAILRARGPGAVAEQCR